MDFRELTYILAVADNKSVTEAANKLYISQPSLSYIISKVEDELGVKLFYRKTNPLTLTYAGELYVEAARDILNRMDNLRRELSDVSHGEKGRINIGIPTERAGYMLPKIIENFSRKYPGIELRLTETRSRRMIEELDKGMITIAVLPGDSRSYPVNLSHELIYRERFLMAAAEGMIGEEMIEGVNEDGLPLVSLKKMKNMPFFVMVKGHFTRTKTDQIFRDAGFIPKNVTEVSSNISAAMLAKAGIGIAIIPGRVTETIGCDGLKLYAYTQKRDVWDVNAVFKKDTYLSTSEKELIDIMKETFRKEENYEQGI